MSGPKNLIRFSPTAAEIYAKKMQLEEFKALEVKVGSENLKDSFTPKHKVHLTSLHHNTGRRIVLAMGVGKASEIYLWDTVEEMH